MKLAQERLGGDYAAMAVITRSAYHAESEAFTEFCEELTAKD
jgi:hypothetical protein